VDSGGELISLGYHDFMSKLCTQLTGFSAEIIDTRLAFSVGRIFKPLLVRGFDQQYVY
jgi:hypothetical protein